MTNLTKRMPNLTLDDYNYYLNNGSIKIRKNKCVQLSKNGRTVSIYKNSWRPIELDTQNGYEIDRNIISDIKNKRGEYLTILKKLQSACIVFIELSLLEGRYQRILTPAEIELEFNDVEKLLNSNGIKVEPIINPNARKLNQDDINVYLFIEKYNFPTDQVAVANRIDLVKRYVEHAQCDGINISHPLFIYGLSSFFENSHKNTIWKASDLRKARQHKNSKTVAEIAHNMLSDIIVMNHMRNIWACDAEIRYLTNDTGLIRHLLASSVESGERHSIDAKIVFPGLTNAELKYLLDSNLLRQGT